MKFIKILSGIASALLFVSCAANNSGYNTGNVNIDLGAPVMAAAGGYHRAHGGSRGGGGYGSCGPECGPQRSRVMGGQRMAHYRHSRNAPCNDRCYAVGGGGGHRSGGGRRIVDEWNRGGGSNNYNRPYPQQERRRPDRPEGPLTVQGDGGTMYRHTYIDAYGGESTAGYSYGNGRR